jgi:hypothetical protein
VSTDPWAVPFATEAGELLRRVRDVRIALLAGHIGGSQVTEGVYRKQLRPVIQTGATAMDDLFGGLDQGQANGA